MSGTGPSIATRLASGRVGPGSAHAGLRRRHGAEAHAAHAVADLRVLEARVARLGAAVERDAAAGVAHAELAIVDLPVREDVDREEARHDAAQRRGGLGAG